MLKLKQGIIYIVVLCLFSDSFIGSAWGTPVSVEEAPPPVIDTTLLESADQELAKGATFYLPTEAKQQIAEEMQSSSKSQSWVNKTKVVTQSTLISTAQSLVTSLVFLGASEVRKRAHEKNLNLTPDNVQKLTDELGQDWSQVRTTVFSSIGSAATGLVNLGFVAAVRKNPAIDDFLKKEMGLKLFKYLVSGVLFSIGNDYINGFVTAGAELVLAYPDKFGGVSQEEQGAIKLLQSRANFTYFVTELFTPSKLLFQSSHQSQVLRSAHAKVITAMGYILFRDEQLRSALINHLFSSAFLQGKSVIMIGTSLLSEQATTRLVSKNSTKLRNFSEGVGISILMGLVGSLIPNQGADLITVWENRAAAVAERNSHLFGIERILSQPINDEALSQVLNIELSSREARLIKYAYLMKLCLDRVDAYDKERTNLLRNHNSGVDQFANFKKLKETTGRLLQSYNTSEGYVDLKAMTSPAKGALNQIVGLDVQPYSWKISSNNRDIAFYQNLFKAAAAKMVAIYTDDQKLIQSISNHFSTPEQQDRIQLEIRNLIQMQLYISHLNNLLSQKWTMENPSVSFYTARQLLEEISFWGIRENDVIKTLNALSFTNEIKVSSK